MDWLDIVYVIGLAFVWYLLMGRILPKFGVGT